MGFTLPTLQDYEASAHVIEHFLSEHQIGGILYGSSIHNQEKPGLSDADWFFLAEKDEVLFPRAVSEAFWKVRTRIEVAGIPLQVGYHTHGSLSSSLFHPDTPYTREVLRGRSYGHHPERTTALVEKSIQRRVLSISESMDDYSMSRNFLRKIQRIGETIAECESIIHLGASTPSDQKALRRLWDDQKKALGLMTLALRIKTKKSYFSESPEAIGVAFTKHFSLREDEKEKLEAYLRFISSIDDLSDWILWLQRGGFERLRSFYDDIFTLITRKVSTL